MGYQLPITIAKAIAGIQSNQFVLPAIQREFVWKPEQVEQLFDSLMKDYPIGIFLFWKIDPKSLQRFQFYRFMDHYHERDYTHNEPITIVGGNETTAVLDGQQRLTALNIGLRGWYAKKLRYYHWSNDKAFPRRKLYLDLIGPSEDSEKDFEFRFLRKEDLELSTEENGKHWFPVEQILEFEDIKDPFDYCVEQGLVEGGETFPHHTLIKLWEIVHKESAIHYFQEEEQDLDKVLNIFIRVNSGGTELSYSDLLLSIATAQWGELDARQEIYGLVDELNGVGEGFDFNKDFVLKSCLVLSDTRRIEFKVENFNRDNMLRIEEQWDGISRALRLTVGLISSWGYSRETLASNYAAIPIAYHLYKLVSPPNFVLSAKYQDERERIRKWLMVALLKRMFSGQADGIQRTIREVLQQNGDSFPSDVIAAKLAPTAKNMSFDQAELEGLLGYQYGKNYTFTVLALLYPWLKYDQHFHVDHIFPRGMFTKKRLQDLEIPEEQWGDWFDHINDLANLQILQGIPNQEKSDAAFEEWLAAECSEPFEKQSYLENHLIPDVDLRFENFPGFLMAREKLLIGQLSDLVEVSRDAGPRGA